MKIRELGTGMFRINTLPKLLLFSFLCEPTVSFADEYTHNALCGWSDLNAVPCAKLRELMIYTAVPGGGKENIDKMIALNARMSEWLENNDDAFKQKDIEFTLTNTGNNHYYPPPKGKTEAALGVFINMSEGSPRMTFTSATAGSIQSLTYECDSPDVVFTIGNCEKALKNLLQYFMF